MAILVPVVALVLLMALERWEAILLSGDEDGPAGTGDATGRSWKSR